MGTVQFLQVRFVGDGKIEEAPQMTTNEFDHGITPNFRAIRQRALKSFRRALRSGSSASPSAPSHLLSRTFLKSVVSSRSSFFAISDRLARVRVDHAALVPSRLGHVECMTPEMR